MAERAEFPNAVVILVFVLRYYEAATVFAWQWPLRIVLALLEVNVKRIKLDYLRAAIDLIIARDVEARKEIAQDPRNRSKVGCRDGLSINWTCRLTAQPLLNASRAECVLA